MDQVRAARLLRLEHHPGHGPLVEVQQEGRALA